MDKDYTEKAKTLEEREKKENWTIVEGIQGKARPVVTHNHTFTPRPTVVFENRVKDCYQQNNGSYYKNCAVKAEIVVWCKIPKSYTKKRTQAILEGLERPTKKPDLDNVAKIILDSLNNIAFDDDSQVVELSVSRFYTQKNERISFVLSEVF